MARTVVHARPVVDAPGAGHAPIRKLTPQHLSDLYATLNLSPASIAHLHRVLRSALAEGMRWNVIARNPADAVRAPRAKPREMTILTPHEVRLLRSCQGRRA